MQDYMIYGLMKEKMRSRAILKKIASALFNVKSLKKILLHLYIILHFQRTEE